MLTIPEDAHWQQTDSQVSVEVNLGSALVMVDHRWAVSDGSRVEQHLLFRYKTSALGFNGSYTHFEWGSLVSTRKCCSSPTRPWLRASCGTASQPGLATPRCTAESPDSSAKTKSQGDHRTRAGRHTPFPPSWVPASSLRQTLQSPPVLSCFKSSAVLLSIKALNGRLAKDNPPATLLLIKTTYMHFFYDNPMLMRLLSLTANRMYHVLYCNIMCCAMCGISCLMVVCACTADILCVHSWHIVTLCVVQCVESVGWW